jgi:hypothetical protein
MVPQTDKHDAMSAAKLPLSTRFVLRIARNSSLDRDDSIGVTMPATSDSVVAESRGELQDAYSHVNISVI